MEKIVIEHRYCGPANSGNGGYVAGLLAKRIGPVATVRLQRPPPLDTPLTLEGPIDGRWYLRDDGVTIAMGSVARLDLEVPSLPRPDRVAAAVDGFAGFENHWFPCCFGCGTERSDNDGLRIFPGPVGEGTMVAAPWRPDASLAADGEVASEFLWTALDCAGAWAIQQRDSRSKVLGTLTASIERLPQAGEQCSVIGWPLGGQGRKHEAGTAVYDSAGRLCGSAKAIWIVVE